MAVATVIIRMRVIRALKCVLNFGLLVCVHFLCFIALNLPILALYETISSMLYIWKIERCLHSYLVFFADGERAAVTSNVLK